MTDVMSCSRNHRQKKRANKWLAKNNSDIVFRESSQAKSGVRDGKLPYLSKRTKVISKAILHHQQEKLSGYGEKHLPFIDFCVDGSIYLMIAKTVFKQIVVQLEKIFAANNV